MENSSKTNQERIHLPDRLYSGDLVQSKSGHQAEIVVTSERDHFDQPLYRLRHIEGIAPGIVGRMLVSRDDMDREGIVLVKSTKT